MIGEKLLSFPEDIDSARVIISGMFFMVCPEDKESIMHNAKKLVELNNEVYNKIQKLNENGDI